MCDPTTIAITSTAVSAGSSILQGVGERKLARSEARADEAQGRAEINSANERANRIRLQGQQFLAQQRLDMAAGGIDIGSGSALEVGAADAAAIELDALTEMYGGLTRDAAYRSEAKYKRQAGNAALISGVFRAATDVLSTSKMWPGLGSTSSTKLGQAGGNLGKRAGNY